MLSVKTHTTPLFSSMELHSLASKTLRWTNSISLSPTTHLTKVPKKPILQILLTIKSCNRGLQKQPKQNLSRILRTDAAIRAIEQKANSKKYTNLWPKAVLEALHDAISRQRWESALKIFGLLRNQHWYEPRCQTYTKLLMMLGKCRRPDEATLLFNVMLSEGLKPTIDVYTALLSVYGQSGQLDKAFSVVDDMKSASDCKPDVYTYTVLLKCCAKFAHFDLIRSVLAEMSYLGIECNAVTYNTIIDAYGKAEMFEEMENSLIDMIESGCAMPDLFTFNSVVGAYGKSGQIENMEKWYDEFQVMRISPDITTFNILIRSYGKACAYEKMRSVTKFMEKRFFSPTVVTYNIIIETFGRVGNIEMMDEFFKTMKHKGVKPNTVTYCTLVSAYSKARLIMKVDSVLRQVENSDAILDTPFFNCVISAYGRAGEIKKMVELFLAMKDKECKPDRITFSTMIEAYKSQGMFEAAQDMETKMINSGRSGLSFWIDMKESLQNRTMQLPKMMRYLRGIGLTHDFFKRPKSYSPHMVVFSGYAKPLLGSGVQYHSRFQVHIYISPRKVTRGLICRRVGFGIDEVMLEFSGAMDLGRINILKNVTNLIESVFGNQELSLIQ